MLQALSGVLRLVKRTDFFTLWMTSPQGGPGAPSSPPGLGVPGCELLSTALRKEHTRMEVMGFDTK